MSVKNYSILVISRAIAGYMYIFVYLLLFFCSVFAFNFLFFYLLFDVNYKQKVKNNMNGPK